MIKATRKCIRCGEEKLLIKFDKNKKTCSICEYKRATELHKQKIKENRMKVCTKCGKTLHIKNFGVKRGECKECNRKRVRLYYSNNIEKRREFARKYHLEHKDHRHMMWKQWKDSDPYKYWAYNTRSQHKFRGCKIQISISELTEIAKRSDKCAICDSVLDWTPNKKCLVPHSPSLDRLNNENVISKDNIMIICHMCNTTKLGRTFVEFLNYCKNVVDKFKEDIV